ncbi:hypothetical protein DAPPUDRAFT_333416 [Daphnia pulex]|uniref:Conserved oligomeric Golgi complex subunit 3 C-terminal domain-containing protein n=1 Tax=Daphnia pulex TaxID=6669 RepID=E9HSR4_DAPPU|nr:hypothetical protein DAPPUDRAFT_333416 [Daphnia pulex]|eukprot:EFX65207.1 hypothetical protein DAPPUDRAFT_333416 [Daphnia pulex]
MNENMLAKSRKGILLDCPISSFLYLNFWDRLFLSVNSLADTFCFSMLDLLNFTCFNGVEYCTILFCQKPVFSELSEEVDPKYSSKTQESLYAFKIRRTICTKSGNTPLERALLCLSKLYSSVDRSKFQGRSQEVLPAACVALANAAFQIMTNKTSLDAILFNIKNLLILREQIAPFQVDFVGKKISLDFR